MVLPLPAAQLEKRYAKAAKAYMRGLPLEHFAETTDQATQREITLASLDLLEGRRPEVQTFNELLVQFPSGAGQEPRQVVPDNMVVVHEQPIKVDLSFDIPLQPARPLLVLDYISEGSRRKDYDEHVKVYERKLKVPFYLAFYPDKQNVCLYRHGGRKYARVRSNKHGRYSIPNLELEVGLRDGWMRYWHRGSLLLLPAEMCQELDKLTSIVELEKRRVRAVRREQQALKAQLAIEEELARVRAELEELRRGRNDEP
jgi:Uma2 family endonuclease